MSSTSNMPCTVIGGGVKRLLDRCYPKPPRNVWDRMLQYYKPGDPIYTLVHDTEIVGMVYCARHSKGGHLENLAVDPDFRGMGFGGWLIEALVQDNPGVITLSTRIPKYFERFGFVPVRNLDDGAAFMYLMTLRVQEARFKPF